MKILNSVVVMVLLALSSYGVTFEKLFSARSTDVFRCVREVPAGGYVCAGYTADSSANDSDAYVVRLNTNGDTIWTFKYNGPNSRKDLFYKVVPTADNGFICCGYATGTAGSDDMLILKLNSSGHQQWVKKYGGSGKERAQDIIQTADGNYVVCGYTTTAPATYYDAFIYRLNTIGDTIWTNRFGGGFGSYDDANSIKEIPNGYLMGGQSSVAGGYDQYLIKTDTGGAEIWQKRFGTAGTDNIECVTILSDGYLLAGTTNGLATGDDGYVVKTDTSGTPIWGYAYGDTAQDDFHRIEVTSSGDFIASGTTSSIGALNPNMWLAKISSSGTLMWQKAYGGDNHDHGYSAEQTADGGYIIAGHTGSFGYYYEEAYVVKTDANGDISNPLVYTTVLNLLSPNPATCGSANTPVTVLIRNFSNASIANIPVTIQMTGSQTQNFNQVFTTSDDTVTLGTINTTTGGTFTFNCFTTNGNDVTPLRNGITATVSIPAFNAAPTVTGDQRCGTGSLSLSASSAGTIYWYNVASGGSSIATGTAYSTPSISSTTTYYAQTGTVCPSTRTSVVATVNPVPVNPTSPGSGHCGPGPVTITVNSTDNVSWFTNASGGSPFTTGLTYTTPSLSTTTTYYVEASNANCTGARVPVVALISSVAADPGTTPGNRCGPGAVVLGATSSDPVKWYDASSGGNQIGNGTTFITPFISTTTTFYAEADNGCVSNRISAIATIDPLANDPAAPDVPRCGPGSVTLVATTPDAVNWYDAPTGGSNVSSNHNFNTPSLGSSTTYYVEAFNGTCPSNRIAVNAIINQIPSVNLGNDTAVFSGGLLLDAGAGFSSYLWSTGETTQTITVQASNNYCVTITDANTCTNTDCILTDFSVGIKVNELTGVNIYPNPTNGIFRIDLPKGEALLTVTNIAGQVILMQKLTENGNLVDLSSFAKGMYYATIRSKDGVANTRVSLQ